MDKHTEYLRQHVVEGPKSYYQYNDGTCPDHWFEPVQVWEVKAADLSISPVYTAAAGIVSFVYVDPFKAQKPVLILITALL